MVTIDCLSFGYKRGPLFEGLTLGLAPGNICGLLGVNGAGWRVFTTLLSRVAAGLNLAVLPPLHSSRGSASSRCGRHGI